MDLYIDIFHQIYKLTQYIIDGVYCMDEQDSENNAEDSKNDVEHTPEHVEHHEHAHEEHQQRETHKEHTPEHQETHDEHQEHHNEHTREHTETHKDQTHDHKEHQHQESPIEHEHRKHKHIQEKHENHKHEHASHEDKNDDEINIDFSKIKEFFTSKTLSWLVILLLILIPVAFTIYIRILPEYLPAADGWAQSSVNNYYKNQLSQQITAQYPNLPDANKQTMIDKQFADFQVTNKVQLQQQVQNQLWLRIKNSRSCSGRR